MIPNPNARRILLGAVMTLLSLILLVKNNFQPPYLFLGAVLGGIGIAVIVTGIIKEVKRVNK